MISLTGRIPRLLALASIYLASIAGWTETTSGQTETTVAPTDVEFATHIWPIIRAHCLDCHGASRVEGDLRLDGQEHVDRGGHTGNAILGDTLEQSELYRRITSEDETYRMPKEGPPLTPDEIALIQAWIQNGALWQDIPQEPEPEPITAPQRPLTFWEQTDQYLAASEKLYNHVRVVAYLLFAFLVLVLILERLKKLNKAGHRWSTGVARPVFAAVSNIKSVHYMLVVLCLVLAGLWLFHRGTLRESQYTISKLEKRLEDKREAQVTAARNAAQAEAEKLKTQSPVPPRPRHPKRLGGEYYRGNDERNPKLFNGGHYRTATLRVWLANADRHRLEWGDDAGPEDLFICVEIEKANHATPTLFTEEMMASTFISRQAASIQAPRLKDVPVRMKVVTEGQHWQAFYKIGTVNGSGQETLTGMLYVNKGKVSDDGVSGLVHYGINYDVQLDEGTISKESEVWMGSLYRITRLHIPPDDKVPLHEWFDFLPIPEIVGGNTEDPELLGVPEHLPQGGSSGETSGALPEQTGPDNQRSNSGSDSGG